MTTVVLAVDRLSKHYGALAAVDDLSFEVHDGETLGVAGPNGAGKTTLFDVISGHARASSGSVTFMGRETQAMPTYAIRRCGLARTFQVSPVFRSQTVFGHIVIASQFGESNGWRAGLGFGSSELARAREAADFVGLGHRLADRADLLTTYDRKRLMIAAAIVTRPKVLMLDEPVGGLTADETAEVMRLVGELKSDGMTILLIEHVMSVLVAVSDRVLVMHQGAKLFEGSPEEFRTDPEVVRVYLGGALDPQPAGREL
jgi:branched-chain amino acid transport system ATP-binding protein